MLREERIALALAALFLAVTFCSGGKSPEVLYGDADANGVVEQADVDCVLRYVVHLETEIDSVAADVNLSGDISAYDAALIQRFLAGEITLPYVARETSRRRQWDGVLSSLISPV